MENIEISSILRIMVFEYIEGMGRKGDYFTNAEFFKQSDVFFSERFKKAFLSEFVDFIPVAVFLNPEDTERNTELLK